MNPVTHPFYIKLGFILIILLALGRIGIMGESILTPLLFSFLFAILLQPMASFLERKARLPRSVAAIIAVLVFISALALVLYLIGIQLGSLSHDWPLLKTHITLVFHDLQQWAVTALHIDAQRQLAYINSATQNLLQSGTSIAGRTVLSLSSLLLFLVFVFLYSFFILYYRRLLVRFVTAAFAARFSLVISGIIQQIKSIIRSYIVGLFLQMALVSAIAILIFSLLGIKYAFLLGLIIGVFNIIPYVGIFSALLISLLVTFATGSPAHALYVAITGVCIHLADSNFIMPKVVGSHVKINPFFVVLGVVTGELIWGIPGMFLALPYLAIAKVIFDRVDGLQPWGMLLGEEEPLPKKPKPWQRRLKKKSDPPV